MAYDKMKWHYDGDYPGNLPTENAGTHIGFFITWCIENNLMSEDILEDCEKEIRQVKDRVMDGRAFLISMLDETFSEDDLNEEGQSFAESYYEDDIYLEDLIDTIGDDLETVYEIENSWANYDLMKVIIDDRFKEWKEE